MRITRRTTTVLAAAAAAAGITLLAGCSADGSDTSMEGHSMGSSTSTESSSARSADPAANFTDADVRFASMMYPHHAQAVEMATMVDGRTTTPEIVALAGEIAAAQKPEMDQLTSWLAQWGQPSSDASSMEGTDHGSGSGMMTAQDMDSLTAASGAEFDRQWLTMMIAHHRGAVTMAEKEIADGSNTEAVAMARTIVETQNAEVSRMQQLLG